MKELILSLLILTFGVSFAQKKFQTIKNIENDELKEDLSGTAIKVYKYKKQKVVGIYYFDKDSIPVKYRTHTEYKYDNLNRLIKSQDYINKKKMDWEFSCRKIEYFKDSIILSFPLATKELDEIEKMFEKPSKIVFLLDSVNHDISEKKYLNLKNEVVPFTEMRITHETYKYDSYGRLQHSMAHLNDDSVWLTELNYVGPTVLPEEINVKMDSTSKEYDWTYYFTYGKNGGYSYKREILKSIEYSTTESTNMIMPKFGQFHPQYWDNPKKIRQLQFTFEVEYLWLNH